MIVVARDPSELIKELADDKNLFGRWYNLYKPFILGTIHCDFDKDWCDWAAKNEGDDASKKNLAMQQKQY